MEQPYPIGPGAVRICGSRYKGGPPCELPLGDHWHDDDQADEFGIRTPRLSYLVRSEADKRTVIESGGRLGK